MTRDLDPAFRQSILPLCQDPLMAGLVLQLTLLAPMSQYEVSKVYTDSMIKEMMVMESVKRTCTINFEPFFGTYSEAIHPDIPCNERVSRYIHNNIDHWIDSLSGRVLYPKVGGKTVSRVTSDELRRQFPTYEPYSEIGITPIDLERIYHRYAVVIPGPCEMRQKWYSSILKPRSYYTQGGDAYHTSKYLADILVDLCDTLPATNRRSRVRPSRITIRDPTSDVAYYDLTSFTSNLHVQCEFMYRLGKYCEGTVVRILDAVTGIIEVDLGALIHTYTRVNLDNPSYTLPPKYADPTVLHYHSVAGFLGVYGNIASATFIHGIVVAMLHEYLDENNVAGDDGLDVTTSVERTLSAVSALGVVSDEKTFRDSEGCCIHLKRPITRIGEHLIQGQLITWPSLEPIQNECDIRYPYLQRMTVHDRKDAIAGSVTAFLRNLEYLSANDDELEVIDRFLSSLYDACNLPKEGCVPQSSGKTPHGFVPTYEKRFIGMDPLTNTIMRRYTNIAKLPMRGKLPWEYGMLDDGVFRCNSTQLLSYLVKLGYLDQEKESCLVYGEEGMKQLVKEYTNPDPPIYVYTVLCKLPDWIVDCRS